MDENVELARINADAGSAVLRDITHRYLLPQSPNSKGPIRPTAESSLPPSSPPSTSSHIPILIPNANDHPYPYPEIQSLPSDPNSDYEAAGGDGDPEDPFGFLALERKLKATRARATKTLIKADMGTVTPIQSDSSPNISPQQAFATPKPLNPLRTPRKRTRGKKRKLPSSSSSSFRSDSGAGGGESDVSGSHMPSSPSPVKVSHQGVDIEFEGSGKKGKGKETDARKRGRKKIKPTAEEATLDPQEIVKNLEALLPRRSTKGAHARTAKVKGRKPGSATMKTTKDDTIKHRNNKSGTGKAKVSKQRAAKDNGDGVDLEGGEEEEEEDEKQARERQARIEYFRKVDGYEVLKENVYVV